MTWPRREHDEFQHGELQHGELQHGELHPYVIDGEETESVSGARFASIDPWTREPYDEGPWPRIGYAERGALLHRFADLIVANADALGLADTTDMGKPIGESHGNARN